MICLPCRLSPDATKTSCVATCGDSKRTSSETCNDGDTTSGDGCSSSCAIEAGAIWNGGNASSPDACNICSAGLYPNTGNTIWEPHCADSKRAGSETCDDGKETDGGGCSSLWAIESNFVWSGGSVYTLNLDCWNSFWAIEAGWTCSDSPSVWQKWGDSKIEGTEAWDDGNTANGDGWNSSWAVEAGWTCNGSVLSIWQKCGNSIKEGTKTWDDGNTVSSDGWSSSCLIESSYSCTSATPNVCSLIWSNGVINTGEAWDDGNTSNGDGWSSTW